MSEPRINLPVSKLEDEIERLQAENAAIVAERDEWMAARNQWCARAQRMGERAAKAEGERDETIRQHQGHLKVWRIERDALQQQLAERDAEIERLKQRNVIPVWKSQKEFDANNP